MSDLCFVIPAHGRFQLAAACFKGMRWTLDTLRASDIDATAIVVACDENLDAAHKAGLLTVEAPNEPLGARWNAGIETALRFGAEWVVPCGSDDLVHPLYIQGQMAAVQPEDSTTILATRLSSVVREDGKRLVRLGLPNEGGDGIQFLPRGLLARVKGRPADSHRNRAMDTTMRRNLARAVGKGLTYRYLDSDALWIVDFKSDSNLNPYDRIRQKYGKGYPCDPWVTLPDLYPEAVLAPIRACY